MKTIYLGLNKLILKTIIRNNQNWHKNINQHRQTGIVYKSAPAKKKKLAHHYMQYFIVMSHVHSFICTEKF